ncbi:MAG: ZIP family metal transporter [Candidatus Micrarchaeota archaeon]
MVLELIIGATVLVSLASLCGIAIFNKREKYLQPLLLFFVSFSAGTLLGAAFLDLLPESMDSLKTQTAMLFVLGGFIFFFILEKIIHWHHHHSTHEDAKAEIKPLGYLNLVGDGLHNFIDGAAIAASFMAGVPIGISTTIAVLLHEIPQEIGDYSLLMYAGFKKKEAIKLNLLSAALAILGACLFYYFGSLIENLEGMMLAFTAGMFTYIASTDLVPEIHKETDLRKSAIQLGYFLMGILLIWLLVQYLPNGG